MTIHNSTYLADEMREAGKSSVTISSDNVVNFKHPAEPLIWSSALSVPAISDSVDQDVNVTLSLVIRLYLSRTYSVARSQRICR